MDGCMNAYMVVYFGWLNACLHAGKTVRSYADSFIQSCHSYKKQKKKAKKLRKIYREAYSKSSFKSHKKTYEKKRKKFEKSKTNVKYYI